MIKRIASALGTSINTLTRDYEKVNYSSLRQNLADEKKMYENWTRILLEGWKEVQYEIWLEHNYPQKASDLIQCCTWQVRKDPYIDVLKDVEAVSKKIELGLTTPLMQLQSAGLEPEEVLKSAARWKDLCVKYGITFATPEPEKEPESEEEPGTESEDQESINTEKEQ